MVLRSARRSDLAALIGRGENRSRRNVRALWIAVGLDFLAFGLVFPILPLFARHLGLPIAGIGALLASYSLAQLVAAPAWGRFSDRRGRRPALIVSLVGTALSALLIATAPSAALLFVAVIVNGASGGSIGVAQASVLDVVAGDEQARAMGLVGASVAVGFVIGPALAALASLGGARLPFAFAAGIGGANALLAFLRVPETRGGVERPVAARAGRRSAAPVSRQAALELLAAFGLTAVAFGVFEATFALVVRRHFGYGEAGAGLCFALVGVVMALTQARGIAPLLARLGARRSLILSALSLLAGLVVVGVAHEVALLVFGLVLLAFGYGVLTPIVTPFIARSGGATRRATVLGRQQSVASLARILGPLAGGVVLALGGALATYVFAAVVVAGAGRLVLARAARLAFDAARDETLSSAAH